MTKRKISSSQMNRSRAQNQPIDEKQNSLKRMSTMRKQYILRRQQTLQQQEDMKRNKQVKKEVEKGLDGFHKFQGKILCIYAFQASYTLYRIYFCLRSYYFAKPLL